MSDPQIEKLLIVQDRDTSLQKIEQDLARLPLERAAIEKLIAEEEGNIEKASHALKEKEVQRHELDVEVKSKEAALARFRTQQLEIKKNDEYQAMTHQIEQTELEIGQLEEKEIELMLEIDTTREAFEAERKTIEERIVIQKKEIALLSEREANLNASIDEAKAAVEGARSQADESFLEHYDRVKNLTKRPPYVAPIEAHKCGGCHLRVSNEVSKTAFDHGEPHFCDQCARIVYA
ncbi:MAG: zinc ribbon domain-containing protein [Opitutaceae bacterium]